jgi:MFS transporter, NNP family, nitrate/nitrite transporter
LFGGLRPSSIEKGVAAMHDLTGVSKNEQNLALWSSTLAFTVCFAVWTIFSILGVQIKKDLGLNDTEFGLLIATPILTGSLVRLALGIWTDQYGGRVVYALVMMVSAVATWLVTWAHTYQGFLLAALGVGISGGGFAVGIAYVSRWYPKDRQGTALGIFGMGNVGAAVTKFVAPWVMVAFGWQMVANVWAAVIFVSGVLFFLTTKDDPVLRNRLAGGHKPETFRTMMAPLREMRVWRFSLYYFFVFGGFVALALWLPRYYMGAYGLDVKTAGMLGAAYSIPASIFRALGGWMSDKWGARSIMYWTFGVAAACLFVLCYPATDYVIHGVKGDIAFSASLGFLPFTVVAFVLGFFMSLGKAAVYKHIPVYYPHHVGSVGGVVGLIGGLGGFVLPIAFGALNDLTGVWTSCFMLMFLVVAVSLGWMHFAIRRMERDTLRRLGMSEGPALPVGDGLDRILPAESDTDQLLNNSIQSAAAGKKTTQGKGTACQST